MTYHGVVLLLSGYQADEQHILRQYRAIVEKCVDVPDTDQACVADHGVPHQALHAVSEWFVVDPQSGRPTSL